MSATSGASTVGAGPRGHRSCRAPWDPRPGRPPVLQGLRDAAATDAVTAAHERGLFRGEFEVQFLEREDVIESQSGTPFCDCLMSMGKISPWSCWFRACD